MEDSIPQDKNWLNQRYFHVIKKNLCDDVESTWSSKVSSPITCSSYRCWDAATGGNGESADIQHLYRHLLAASSVSCHRVTQTLSRTKVLQQ